MLTLKGYFFGRSIAWYAWKFMWFSVLSFSARSSLYVTCIVSENARSLFLCEVTDCATRKSSIRVELFSQVKLVRDVHRKRKHTLSIFCYRSRIAWQGEFLFLHQFIASRDLWRIKAEVDFLDIHSRTTQEEGRIYVIEQLRILDDVVAANACLRFGKRYWS